MPRFPRWCAVVWLGVLLASALGAAPEPASQPFTPRSQPASATPFTTLAPASTGLVVENTYDDPRMWTSRYREFTLGAIGTGVAAGDYDGDGRVDLFVASKTNASRLFRNLGHWQFEDVTANAGINVPADEWTQGVAFADVNNDGHLDLYVCRFAAPNLLFINQGDGTFREEGQARGLAVVDASSMAFFADFDRDGALDVYLQTNVLDAEMRPNGQPDYLFRNRGDGTFEDVTARAGIAGPAQGHSATWWDYDADGWPDLYVANDFKDPDMLYRNDQGRKFSNALSWVVPHTPHSSMGADLGDVNNDGHIDLLVADMAATTRKKDHRGMAKLRAGLVDTELAPTTAPQYMRNSLFLNTGAGRMMEAAVLTGLDATDWTWSVRFEDLDQDGWVDLHVTNGMVRELHSHDLVARASALESGLERVRLMRASPRFDEANLAYRNTGDLAFTNVSAAWGLDHVGVSFGAAFADLDGDGDLDLVFTNFEDGLTVCRNDFTTGRSVIFELRGTRSNRFGIGARVEIETAAGRQVRELVLGRGYLSTSEPVVHFGVGEADEIARVIVTWPSGQRQEYTALPTARRYTLVEPAEPAPSASAPPPPEPLFRDITAAAQLLLPSTDAAFNELRRQPLLPLRQNLVGPGAAVADLDGDGLDDLILGGAAGERGRLLSNLGGGQFLVYGSSLFSGRRPPDAAPLALEINGDGHVDLLIAKGGVNRPPGDPEYQAEAWLNDGAGRFTAAATEALPPLTVSAGPVIAADFDRDGDLDVFVGGRAQPGEYPAPVDSVLLVNDGGRFRDATAELAPRLRAVGTVHGALWSDVDGDGWIDLLLAREWDTVLYLRNIEGRGFSDNSVAAGFAAAGSGLWHSIVAGDFNGDGRLDYAVGNVGLNTRYRASPARPAVLFRGDHAGREHIVEATYSDDGDTLQPLAAREQVLPAFPAVARTLPTAEAYSRASLADVVGPSWLETARRFELTELRSGVFLSTSAGGFTFQPLPRLAQIAPIDGLAAGDFDGDGHTDLVAVGNAYAPPATVGRFDGGIGALWRGDGHGGFTFVPATESGIVVPFDGQALCVLDYDADGWPDLFITRHAFRPVAYRHHGAPGRRSFAVALQGPAGNPTAVGARVTLELSDGRTTIGEIAAGNGYLSQSTAAQFFAFHPDNPPRHLHVRWPDGRTSTHPWHDQPRLLLRAPDE